MEPLVGLIAIAIVGSIVFLAEAERGRARMGVWKRAAARVGLTNVEESGGGLFGGGWLSGRSGGVGVRLESYREGRSRYGTRILAGLGHGPGGLWLRRESLGTAIEKRVLGEREIEIGDQSFDDEFYVQGRAPLAIALLDSETRRSVAGLLRNRIPMPTGEWVDVEASVSDGDLVVNVRESGFSGNRERIPDILEVVLDVARRLVAPPDVAARIAANLRNETSAGARAQALRVLAREFPGHPATRDALLAAGQDPSPEVRLRAAIALGEDGRETLLELVNGTDARDECAAQAVCALGKRLPPESAEAALRRALRDPERARTALACLEALALLARTESQGLALEALGHADAAVAVAAARALGKVGTVAAVPALRGAAETGGDLRRAARQAVAEIQARLTGAEPGQLSLAGADAGALSLAQEAGVPGRLTLVDAEPIAPEEEGDAEATGKPTPKLEGQGTR